MLQEHGADVHAKHDFALRYSASAGYANIVIKLLECRADIHCNNRALLKQVKINFSESIADLILPYCCSDDHCCNDDHCNFPTDYIL